MRTMANQARLGKARRSSLSDLVTHQTQEIQTLSDTIAHLELRLRSRKAASCEEAVSDRLGLIEEALGIDPEAVPIIHL